MVSFRWWWMILLAIPAFAAPSGAHDETETQSVKILIAYDSRTGNTESLARAVAEGTSRVAGAEAVLRRQSAVEDAEILDAQGILVGTPIHWANLSTETKGFLDRIGGLLAKNKELGADSASKNRTAGAFVTGGSISSGKELARMSILATFLGFRFVVIGADDAAGFGTLGAAATTGPTDPGLSEAELEEARRFGQRFAEITKKLAN